jgi:hypothetical protein
MKIIAGSDGMNGDKLVRLLRKANRIPRLREAHALALSVDFGSKKDLVVIHTRGYYYAGDDDLNKEYRKTFNEPRFNPRWKFSTADYVKVTRIDLPTR